jgi:uncharacterized membrane protein
MAERKRSRRRTVRYERGSEEFGRVLAFSDGLFAIAMTLLVIGIVVPKLTDESSVGDLADALNHLVPSFISFLISFAVIGRYWLAHHEFIGMLKAIDNGLIGLNLIYLGFIAFLPFPTALLGNLFENPLSVITYAVAVSCVSGMEVVLFRHAYRTGLLTEDMPEEAFRYGSAASLSPLLFFLISIPLAFLSTTVAVASWYFVIPFERFVIDRLKPEGAEEYF